MIAMSMNEFKEAMKNEVVKQEFTAFIDEKKPETPDALAAAVVDFATIKGYSISKEVVMDIIPDEMKSGKMELSDDMLGSVVGGSLWTKIKDLASDIADAAKSLFSDDDGGHYNTMMMCSNCGKHALWAGQYVGQTVECSDCHHFTFKGEYNV